MAIASSDVKLLKSQRLTDEADGGGRATGVAIVDGEVNNLFPDLSRLDRTAGDVALRKVFAGAMTSNDDAYLGAHIIVTDAPADPRVSVLLFNTNSQTDERRDARDAIESYVAAASSAPFELLGTQLVGQRAIAVVQREEQRIPEQGEVYQLSGLLGSQYVKVMDVAQRLEQFTYDYGNGNFVTFARRRLDLTLMSPLQFTFYGGQPTPAGTSANAITGQAKAQVLSTQVSDSARYYGLSPLAEAVSQGALSAKVQSVYSQLVPSTTKESALVDLLAGYQRQVYLPCGASRSISLTVAAAGTAGESRTFLGTGCAPGTLSITVNGGTYADDYLGGLRHVSGTNWISSARVDYQTGEITLVRNGSSWSGAANASYRPGVAPTADTISGELEITLATRGYVYTLNLSGAVPRQGTLSVSYMALGKWYELRDYGDGLLTGEGAGTINFATGSASITLNALPDVGSSLIYHYVSAADNSANIRTASGIAPKVRYQLPDDGIAPGSVAISYPSGSNTLSLSDNGAGVLSGTGGTGTIVYATGEVELTLAATPSGAISYSYEQATLSGQVLTLASDGSGMVSFTVPGAPLEPGSVHASWMTTRRQAAPAMDGDAVKSGNALPVFDGLVDVARSAADNGSGGWKGAAGSINYSTGACTLQVASLYDYIEYTYSNRKKTGVIGFGASATEPVLITTPVSVRETFGGTLTVNGLPAGASAASATASQAAPALVLDLLPAHATESIVPGSLLFSYAGATYVDRNGIIYRDINSATNAGIACGTIDYTARRVSLNTYTAGASGSLSILACLTVASGFAVTALTWRTPGAPLRTGSMQISAVRLDTAEVISAAADANGNFASGVIHGSVDVTTGIARVLFTTDPDDDSGASDVPVIPLLSRYNAVVQSVLPMDAGLLGLDPVRLPSDGRVPIFNPGNVLVLHHTAKTTVASPTAGGVLVLDRDHQAAIEVFDANGLALRKSSYSVDLEAGTLAWANPLVLQAEDGTPLVTPLEVRDRVEHMTLCAEVQITGQVGFSAPVPWDLPAGEAKLSSAVVWGDLQARLHSFFTQQTWSQGAPNWSNTPTGNTTTAQYNTLSYPPVVTNKGSIAGKWALVFTSGTAFQVVEEKLGVITTGNTSSDCAPINALTGEPYFLIKKEGWGSGWAAGNAVRFNTDSALGAVWCIRATNSGQGTVADDQFKLQIRGDAD